MLPMEKIMIDVNEILKITGEEKLTEEEIEEYKKDVVEYIKKNEEIRKEKAKKEFIKEYINEITDNILYLMEEENEVMEEIKKYIGRATGLKYKFLEDDFYSFILEIREKSFKKGMELQKYLQGLGV